MRPKTAFNFIQMSASAQTASLLIDTRAELAELRGPDAVSFAQSIGLYNPALIDGYARLLEREIARLERLADRHND